MSPRCCDWLVSKPLLSVSPRCCDWSVSKPLLSVSPRCCDWSDGAVLCDWLCPLCSDLDILVDSFNSECSGILDSIAPFKKVKSKTVSQPWLNAESRLLRQKWRQAERRWKSDKLQVSYETLRDCLHTYQQYVKSAKAHYFSALFSQNHHCPRVLFRTINTVLNSRFSCF